MRLSRNILVATVVSGWTALIGLAVVPFYLRLLGIEAYGLIGFYVSLSAMLQVLDMGLAPATNRELARAQATGRLEEGRRLLHTTAVCYTLVGLLLGVTIIVLSPWLATRWFHASKLDSSEVRSALQLIGLVIACRWPFGLYQNAVIGLQRLDLASLVSAGMTTAGSVGAVLMLSFFFRSILAFFVWQAVVAIAGVTAMRVLAWRLVGREDHLRFETHRLRSIWRFSAGMTIVAILSVVVTQLDKVILSRMLPLSQFGTYALSWTIAGGIFLVTSPFFNALFPRFSAIVSSGAEHELVHLYHRSTRMLCAVLLPCAFAIIFFADAGLLLWTHDPAVSSQTAPLIRIVVLGSAINGVMHMPYALQLAYGAIRLALYIAVSMCLILIPMIVLFTLKWGAMGGASAWLALNVFYLVFGTWITHRRLLRGIALSWLSTDIGLPAIISVLGVGAAWTVAANHSWSPLSMTMVGSLAVVICVVVNFSIFPDLRQWASSYLTRNDAAHA